MVGRATEMIVRSIEVTRLAVPRTRTATFQPRGEILAPYMVHGSRQPPGLLLALQGVPTLCCMSRKSGPVLSSLATAGSR